MSEADERAISATLTAYQQALNSADTDAVMNVYTADGVFMSANSPTNVGAAAVRAAYDAAFKAVGFDIAFTTAEIRQVAPDWAFVRTNSKGTTTLRASNTQAPEANQELFVFQKVGGQWKIARYCFSTTLPASS